MLGGPVATEGDLGQVGVGVAIAAVSPSVGQAGQVNSVPLGSITGAPPWAKLQMLQVIPFVAVGVTGQTPTLVASRERQNRVIIVTAPLVGFSVYIGDSGVRPGYAFVLPGGLPYDIIIPGGQELYAVTDAPTFLALQVQSAPLLTGDKERRATAAP